LNRFSKIRNDQAGNPIDGDQLLAYLEGRMSPEDQHTLEAALEADPFLNDAIEGLSEVRDKQQLQQIATQLNVHLRKQIRNRKQRRRGRRKLTEHWGWLYVLIVLALILLGWWVIRTILNK